MGSIVKVAKRRREERKKEEGKENQLEKKDFPAGRETLLQWINFFPWQPEGWQKYDLLGTGG